MNKYYNIKVLFKLYIILPVIASLLIFCNSSKNEGISNKTNVIDDVFQRGSIRCSYLIYQPYFMKDPNTGEFSGIFHDIMMRIGKRLNLRIEWTEEVGYETIFEGLKTRRHDVFAGGLWPSSERAKVGYFTDPVFYCVIKAYAKLDDSRFKGDLEKINSPSIRISTIDGEMSEIIANSDFPKAKKISLPQMTPVSQNLMNVATGKADVTFVEPTFVNIYHKSHNVTFRDIFPEQSVRIFGNTYVVKRGADEFLNLLNVTLRELLYSGVIEKILRKYEPYVGAYPRVKLPYRILDTTKDLKTNSQ